MKYRYVIESDQPLSLSRVSNQQPVIMVDQWGDGVDYNGADLTGWSVNRSPGTVTIRMYRTRQLDPERAT